MSFRGLIRDHLKTTVVKSPLILQSNTTNFSGLGWFEKLKQLMRSRDNSKLPDSQILVQGLFYYIRIEMQSENLGKKKTW